MKLIIFDLDGTLVDSLPDLVRTVNAAMADYAAHALPAERIAPWVGRGSRVLLGSALRHHGIDPDGEGFDFEAAFARFLDHYARNLVGESRLFPGVADALQTLSDRGLILAVCTNKPSRFVAPLLEALAIAPYFAATLGGDSLEQRKPHPAPLLHLARQFGCLPAQALMVGDSRHDVEAARAAAMPVVGVSYGYGSRDDFQRFAPDAVFDTLTGLPGWLDVAGAAASGAGLAR